MNGTRAAFAMLLLSLVVACSAPVAVPSPVPATSSPSPTVEPTATASPSPSPTAVPTAVPEPTQTPRPRPTTNKAGLQLLTYYFQTRQLLPVLPPIPQIDFDEPAGADGDAWYRGLNVGGLPVFAVREDYVMTPSTAYHEIGHAYEDVIKNRLGGVDVRARYWAFRGFPGTWQDALKDASAQPPGMAQWIHLPNESWAEAFSVSMVGGGREKSLDYGRTINPVATKVFFVSLMPPAQ
jgi:hypothetical protein